MRFIVAIGAILILSSCTRAVSSRCDWGDTCPPDQTCHEPTQSCVLPSQIAACDGVAEYTTCYYAGAPADAVCVFGVCVVPRCGNGIIESGLGEMCDDGNTAGGDGCNETCDSDETCGNGVLDTAIGEVCDDGNTTGGDGCSADCRTTTGCNNNGVCEPANGEDATTCPSDCGACDNDGVCEPVQGENTASCPSDCAILECLNSFDISATGRTCVFNTIPEAARTACGQIWESCDMAALPPDITCLGVPDSPPASPPLVTLEGFLDVFSSGPYPSDVVVEVYDAADLVGVNRIDGSVVPLGEVTVTTADLQADIAGGTARGCFSDSTDITSSQVECPLPTGDCGGACQDSLAGTDFCYLGVCYDRLRYEGRFAIPNIPTHRALVIRTSGVNGYSDTTWAVTVQQGVYLRTTDAAYNQAADTYELDAKLLSRQHWFMLPQVTGLSGGISPGYGMVIGEVRDCQGIRLTGAQVGQYPQTPYFAYFNGNPVDSVTLTARLPMGTNLVGLFGEMELPAGSLFLESWGQLSGQVSLLGRAEVSVFEDSVTWINLNDGWQPPL